MRSVGKLGTAVMDRHKRLRLIETPRWIGSGSVSVAFFARNPIRACGLFPHHRTSRITVNGTTPGSVECCESEPSQVGATSRISGRQTTTASP